MEKNNKREEKTNGTALQLLKDIVPLQMPMSLSISMGNVCNLKCNYCYHGSPQKKKDIKNGKYKGMMMTKDMTDLIVSQSEEFGYKYKQATLVGSGEPLVNKDIVYIVKKMKTIAEKVKIVTNATLLTEQLSLDLIEAGVDVIKISFQGMTDKKYLDMCGVNVSVENLIKQIRFLYEHKKSCKVQLKIVDAALDEGEENLFMETFSNITDSVWIEKLSDVDESGKWISDENRWMNEIEKIDVCYYPFYYIYIDQDGFLYPCCNATEEIKMGNIKEKTIKEIWDYEVRNLCVSHLKDGYNSYPACKGCLVIKTMLRDENYLDDKRREILERI